eukprot:TRINITY_DN10646_c0_g1_i1.p1 TRINITY_DN10646_c0_g1~~TRINITY_DN10646_c0_g1_i1.p1  ORF type:complete len:263 (-),score=47.89 TRINITY_DN10646_c0_g1_i1:81-869(-)
MSPSFGGLDSYRIVLTWGYYPSDLDSHTITSTHASTTDNNIFSPTLGELVQDNTGRKESEQEEMATKAIDYTFKSSWRDVFLASWLKYPCDSRPDILSVDIIKKEFDSENGTFKATRLITIKNVMPNWIGYFYTVSDKCYFIEESILDVKNQEFVLKSRNLTYGNLVNMLEVCTYTVNNLNEDWTNFHQLYRSTMQSAIMGVTSKIENYLTDTAISNSVKGREVMEKAIERVKEEYDSVRRECSDFIDANITQLNPRLSNID